ncbi:MAG: indole-3-glycerol phosphate synthase TrpC [Pseudomonadota bacterium]|jgi:indole-3-glycerol phosphate synthase
MNILDQIVAKKRAKIESRKSNISIEALQESISAITPTNAFAKSIQVSIASKGVAIIAESKKASPSAGIISHDYDPAKIAQTYERLGASCISVLTEEDFFFGHHDDLIAVLEKINIPVLRKDFVIDPWQIFESKTLGADCILLIASILSDHQIHEFAELSNAIGLEYLIEVHDEAELLRVSDIPHALIGVNNRNLKDFSVNLDTTLRIREKLDPAQLLISESGIKSKEDIAYLMHHGVNTFLIGESFMRDSSLLAAITND